MARRLVEAGVRFVTVTYGAWDTHSYHDHGIETQLPDLDKAFAGLIQDLDQRGLLDSTLVLIASEFGRTLRVNGGGGQDHWPRVFSIVMAGGGTKRGHVFGASDALVFSFGVSTDKKSLAVKLGGSGDVTETHIVWRSERGMPYVPLPLLVGDYLHIINDLGVYTCIEPVTGKVLHTARALGSTYSSPIAVGNRIYMFEDTGRCTIFENGSSFNVLAKNSLDEEMYTTPAISNGQLFVRTTTALVCISE